MRRKLPVHNPHSQTSNWSTTYIARCRGLCGSIFSGIPVLNGGNMTETISVIDTIALRIPLDIWAPAIAQDVPRTTCQLNERRLTLGAFLNGPCHCSFRFR